MNLCQEFIKLPAFLNDGFWVLIKDRSYLSICNPTWKNSYFDLIAELRVIGTLFFVDFSNKLQSPYQLQKLINFEVKVIDTPTDTQKPVIKKIK